MNTSKLDFEAKKKITVALMGALAIILVLCIVTVAVVGIYRALSSGVSFSGGLDADKLTSNIATKEDSMYGSLILVNELDGDSHEYIFPEGNDHLSSMYSYKNNNGGGGYGLIDSSLQLHVDAIGYAHRMLNKMSEDISGADFVVSSAYRTREQQESLHSTISAGYSDHHTGYCFSVKRTETPLSPEDYDWIHENAQNYGFVIRYPDAKAHLTGVSEYTNCLRYVGVAHANLMKQKDLCLEEYIDYLKANAKSEPIGVKCSNGEEYFIYYYAFEGKQINIQIPKDAEKFPYEVSGTNDGGIIVTVKVK